MRKLITILTAWTCMFAAGCNPGREWAGVYSYASAAIPTEGGAAVPTEYTLTISAKNECFLRIVGYQTNENILCAVSVERSSASVSFVSFEDGSQENQFGVLEYTTRWPLFELIASDGGLSTNWIQLRPEVLRGNPGAYFSAGSIDTPASAVKTEWQACMRALSVLPQAPTSTSFDVPLELGHKYPRDESFQALRTADIPCSARGRLPDLDEQRGSDVKAVKAGRDADGYWVAYTYPAERMKANLHGYMTALVRLDSNGRSIGSQVVSEQMAYEGYVREVRSTMNAGLIRTCIREAELFAYDSNGDIAGELPNPRYTDEACGPPYPIGGTDGRSFFPLVFVAECRREGGTVVFCDERHTTLLSKALRTRAPDFNGHCLVTAMPEGGGRASYAVVNANDGTALPLPFDFVTKGKADYRLSGSTICFDGLIHLDRKARIAGGCYQMTADSFKRVETL